MTLSRIGRLALVAVSMLTLIVHADGGCHLDPNGCPGVVADGDGGPGMDPNG